MYHYSLVLSVAKICNASKIQEYLFCIKLNVLHNTVYIRDKVNACMSINRHSQNLDTKFGGKVLKCTNIV